MKTHNTILLLLLGVLVLWSSPPMQGQDMIITAGTTVKLDGAVSLVVQRDLINAGSVQTHPASTAAFSNAGSAQLRGVDLLSGIMKRGAGTLTLENNLSVKVSLAMPGGRIATGPYTLDLGKTAVITGEQSGSYVVGTLTALRTVGTGASTFGGMGVALNAGADNLGNVAIERMTGDIAITTVGSNTSIKRLWKLSSTAPPLAGRSWTMSWVSDDDNGKSLSTAYVWKSIDDGKTWQAFGAAQNASVSRTVTVTDTSFGWYTVGDVGCNMSCPMDIVTTVDPAQCSARVQFPLVSSNDLCGTLKYSPASGSTFPLGTSSVLCTSGSGSACTFFVTVIDNSAPIPDLATLPTITGECSATITNAPTATDNCAGKITGTTTDPLTYAAQGTFTVHWTFNDGNGNIFTQLQTVIIKDLTPPTIATCASSLKVEGDARNEAAIPDFRSQIVASDNCTATAQLVITQSPAPYTVLPAGTHTVTFTVADAIGLKSTCTSQYTIEPRMEIAPVVSFVAASYGCKTPLAVTRSIRISNSGGHFGSGVMMWHATTTATEITLLSSSGIEGEDLVFRIDLRNIPPGTQTRSISVTAYNSATNAPATNAPFTITVSLQQEPLGTVTVTQPVGTSWTPFLNSFGQKIAEVKSNGAPISSFTVTMYPCVYPQGLSRIRYVRRYYTMASSASNPNVDVRLFYTNTEADPLVSKPSALTVWQRPSNMWIDRGGSSNIYENVVQVNGLTTLAGPFAMAHAWFPKEGEAEVERVPEAVTLSQNYPNPFNPTTTIRFTLPEAATVRLTVHDLFGREVAKLVEGMRGAGLHEVLFDAGDLPSGTYTCTLESLDTQVHRRMLLMK
ncbi:MAG: HYR domain-containing protein [Bacteroidetes bacterium]|nr:HYR domain-containing protein [Bacteroidota bacterium]